MSAGPRFTNCPCGAKYIEGYERCPECGRETPEEKKREENPQPRK